MVHAGARGSRTLQARVSSRRVPGFASTGPAGDHESAAHSGDAGKPHWIDMTARSPPGAEPSAKGRTCSAGPAVIGARLPLACWRSRGYFQTKPIPHRGPVARDGPPGQGFAATGLAAALHRQVAISMAEAKARRRRPAPSETEVARVHRRSQRAGPVQRCLRAGKRPAATS